MGVLCSLIRFLSLIKGVVANSEDEIVQLRLSKHPIAEEFKLSSYLIKCT
jgi:hypothetical protein